MTTETLQVELPTWVAERLRYRIRSGEFPNASAAVEVSLQLSEPLQELENLPPAARPCDLRNPAISAAPEEWERYVLPDRLAAWDAGHQHTLSLDQVQERLKSVRNDLLTTSAH